MNIRGLQRFTLVDYPGKVAAVVFTGGCNFACPYCHNACLVIDPASQPEIGRGELAEFFGRRHGKLDGIVISGGEPTLQPDLPDFAREVKSHGFLVKLDTNGSHPEVIAALHEAGCLDMLGIDYKAPRAYYRELAGCGMPGLAERVRQSIAYALEHAIDLDVRTTVHRSLLGPEALAAMAAELRALGVRRWSLQQFHAADIIDDDLQQRPTYSDRELLELAAELGGWVRVRGLTGIYLSA